MPVSGPITLSEESTKQTPRIKQTTMSSPSVSSTATAAASTAAAGAVLFFSPLRETSETDAATPSHRFTLAATSDAELSALFDAPKQMASNTAVAIRNKMHLGSILEDGLPNDLRFFVLFAVSAVVVLTTLLLKAKKSKQTETADFLSPTTTKRLLINSEMTKSIPNKSKDDNSPSNGTAATDDMTQDPAQVKNHPVRDMHTEPAEADEGDGSNGCCPSPIKLIEQIDFGGKLSKKKPRTRVDADLETIGTVTSTASRGLSNKAKLGKYEVTLRSPFKRGGVGIRTPLKGRKLD